MQLRVLVFDDEECIRYMLDFMLTKAGCEVFTFDDPTSFSRYRHEGCTCDFTHACSDILISDICMPRVSGLQLIENLKKTNCRIPHMALMSGNWAAGDWERAQQLGLPVFEKPFKMNDFRLWIECCRETIPQNRILCGRPLSGAAPVGGYA
jgi:CheY-like chemotaxis protein